MIVVVHMMMFMVDVDRVPSTVIIANFGLNYTNMMDLLPPRNPRMIPVLSTMWWYPYQYPSHNIER